MLPKSKPAVLNVNDDPGDPLFLTPLIKAGKIDDARNLSSVELPPYPLPSFSGYLTSGNASAPILLWLQGGPGADSLFALFTEIGPIYIDSKGDVQRRAFTWNTNYHLLFIDNPVGTGYSFTNNDAGYAKSEDDVANDLYSALTQFFLVYYEYQSSPFYITGESYAGKYVPSISYKIHVENPQAKVKINLKGICIGDGWTDPYSQYEYGPLLFQIGLIDSNQLSYFQLQTALIRYAMEQDRYMDAFRLSDALMDGDLINTTSYFYNVTGLSNYYNYLMTGIPDDLGYYVPFITSAVRRKQIHVGNMTFNRGNMVENMLMNDVMQSINKSVLITLANNYKVLLYYGLLDLICAEAPALNWINKLPWQYADDFRKAEKVIWKVNQSDPEITGYVKHAHDFYLASIRNAGHMAPHDQPRAVLDLLNRFFNNLEF
ncbi:unnamed protein product [Didymodactylos carnosus]|uniref:Carboxypeptidase n=1 Tax=Didymodactylos carnosus TaxID=1234261 RepID=A0A813YG31_9BILA|nr:unnamed protein product [Didymodactylos carnosus]CAF1122348.1 unnamed protein product [Didymodactylos carnosus]CAF3669368.1 unnamed protein product [Didymodactylos carnosus]CAF3897302.1 unnamed protein product [Didymodactylos carnosus]